MSILCPKTTSGEQIPPEVAVNVYNRLQVQVRLWTITQRRETPSSHNFAIWRLLGAYMAPYFPLKYTKCTMHSKKIAMRNCGMQGKSTGSNWGNPHYKLVGWVSNLRSLDSTGICLGEQPHIQTELLEVAELPWNWKYFKISLYFLSPHLSKNLMHLSLSLCLKKSQHIAGCRIHFHLPSTINLHWPVTNFPIGPPDWLMGRSRCPSLYLSWQTALSVIYLRDKCGPSSCWRARH